MKKLIVSITLITSLFFAINAHALTSKIGHHGCFTDEITKTNTNSSRNPSFYMTDFSK